MGRKYKAGYQCQILMADCFMTGCKSPGILRVRGIIFGIQLERKLTKTRIMQATEKQTLEVAPTFDPQGHFWSLRSPK